MNVKDLLQTLAKLDVKLSLDNDSLKINAAKGVLTSTLQEKLKHHKSEILAMLQRKNLEDSEPELSVIVPDVVHQYEPFPLSDLQLGFYLADDPYMEFHVRPHYYLENDRENLDIVRYEAAWNKALLRHRKEINIVNAAMQLQMLRETPSIQCQVRDFRHLDRQAAERELLQVRAQNMRRELPLDRWPWFDVIISLWSEGQFEKARIHYNHNNFFIDGFAMGQLLNEVEAYYQQPDLTLPVLTLSYRDAMLALDALAHSESGEKARRYWFERLADLPPPPPLPQKSGMERRCRSRLNRREQILSAESWKGFKGNAARYGITPTNAVIAAYAEILSAWSHSRHFILSHMVTRRFAEMHPEIQKILGNFASLYPLEIDLREQAPFYQQALQVQTQVMRDIRHLQYGGMQVMQEFNRLKGGFGTAPVPFVVGSVLFSEGYKKSDFSCLETSQTMLDHQFWELSDGRYYYVWDLLEDFFPQGLIDSMWQAFSLLLSNLAHDQSLWEQPKLNLLPEATLQPRWQRNQTQAPLPEGLLHDALQLRADKEAERTAVIASDASLNYGQLDVWSRAVASELIAQQIRQGDLVAVVADRGLTILPAVMGILRARAAYVPVDPALPQERLHYLLNNSGATLILTQRHYVESLRWPEQMKVFCLEDFQALSVDAIACRGTAEDLAYVIYTSGSTGRPKGVMIDHRGAMNTIVDINQRFSIGSEDKIFAVSSFSFDLSVYDIFGSVAAGATLIYPNPAAALNPAHWLDLMLRETVTIWNSVPALMSLLVDSALRQNICLPALRVVLLSGDKIPLDLPNSIRRIAPNAKIFSLGGATEASIWSIYYPINEVDPAWVTIPYGFPMLNQRWHILDDAGRPTPTWVPGELYIAGDGLALGYWRDTQKTANSFVTNPENGERLYRTGDLGRYWPDGCIEFLGRVDFQVKIRGHRVELGEIEAALLEHPAVKENVVTAQIVAGKNVQQLVAYIVLHDAHVGIETLQSFLQKKLPAYMLPTAWCFLDALPVTANGKLDRKHLPAIDVMTDTATTKPRTYTAPNNAQEQGLADIWSQVLALPQIGVEDDFFEIGGQSFDAVRIFAMIKETYGVALSLGDIWQARTVRALALRIHDGGASKSRYKFLVDIKTMGEGEPLFLVHPAGGHIVGYFELAALISCPVYGFQAGGLNKPDADSASIIEMAADYITELKAKQKKGPYRLGGWSSGAIIAFEMAAQLERQGEVVECLLMLDGPAPVAHSDLNDNKLLHWFLEDLALDLPLDALSETDLSLFPEDQQLSHAIECVAADHNVLLEVDQLLPILRVFKNVVKAGSAYQPPQIKTPLMVVRVEDNVVSEFSTHPHCERTDWGWGLFSSGHVHTVTVPGTHHNFLTQVYVNAVADFINKSLSQN